MITKLAFVPMAICGVLFPIFAREWKNYPEKNAHRLMLGLQYTLLIITPLSLFIVFFIPEILNYWTNQEISDNGSTILISKELLHSTQMSIMTDLGGAGQVVCKHDDWSARHRRISPADGVRCGRTPVRRD
jgi:hypothetical protein